MTSENVEQSTRILEEIFAAAQPGAVFGQPVVSGVYTIITASEIAAGGGFGYGRGFGPARPAGHEEEPAVEAPPVQSQPTLAGGGGGGGGGGSTGRPVAVIIVGPEGVTVKPVVDVTKLALTALTALGVAVAITRRMRRLGKA